MTSHDPLAAAFLQGFLMTTALIAAIGAQNVQVLQVGIARRHVLPVVVTCTLSDWLLTLVGVFGFGAWVQSSPLLMQVFRYGGAAFVAGYGLLALRRAWRGSADGMPVAAATPALGRVLATTLAMTYLNPHVYLDTVVLLGSVGAQHPGAARAGFTVGAGLASLAWFTSLGFGAAALSRWLNRPAVWRAIDAGVAAIMATIAAQLVLRPL